MSGPLFSILTVVHDPPLDVLADTVASVLAQEHDDWEWVLVDDGSSTDEVRGLMRDHAGRDSRIRLVEGQATGSVAAANDGIAACRGQFIAFVEQDALLTSDALRHHAQHIAAEPDVDYLYSDEDEIDGDGSRSGTFRKPVWSPERLRGQWYPSHLTVMRASVVREVGGLRPRLEGAEDHDLALRVGEVARRVVHVPQVTYHSRLGSGPAAGRISSEAAEAGRRAVQDHLDRVGIAASALPAGAPGSYRIQRVLDPSTTVSVVIPTIGQSDLIWGARRVLVVEAVRSLLARTRHDNVEVVVVYDEPTPPGVLSELREVAGDRLVLEKFTHAFNYSEKMNVGCLRATGERLVLLNDDVEVITDGWLEQLVAPLDEPDVGLVGAMLYYGDDTIQHAGHAYHYGHYFHPYKFEQRGAHGPFGALLVNREVSGVTAACAAIRRDTFLDIGGFSQALPVNYNDVDLCYKVRSAGLRIVAAREVELYHFESRTREKIAHTWEKDLVRRRWGTPADDPFTRLMRPKPVG